MKLLTLTQQQTRQLLDPLELLAALEEGFKALSSNQLNVPPRSHITAPKGMLLGMPAYMPGQNFSVKLVSIFHESTPSHQGIMALFDSETGAPIALMDAEYITALRTAAAAVLSVKVLARANPSSVAIVGAGVQGATHLKMVATLTSVENILIASRNPAHAKALAAHDARARAVASIRGAVSQADVVCLCTSSPEPVIQKDWLREGTHVSSVGFRAPGAEIPRDLLTDSRIFVEAKTAFNPPPVGSAELQGLSAESGTELGEVLLQLKAGRASEKELTVYKATGHAMEDLVAANLVYRKALDQKVGGLIEL